MSAKPGLKMSELADASGVSAGTIKHYLREGLLPEPVRTSRNMAYYPPEFVDRIRTIKRLQEERFMPLRLIREVLEQADRPRTPRREVLERYDLPANVLDRLAEIGVLTPTRAGYDADDVEIIEAIVRFRAGGYDEALGFTVYDTLRYREALCAAGRGGGPGAARAADRRADAREGGRDHPRRARAAARADRRDALQAAAAGAGAGAVSFYEPLGDGRFASTPHTRGPWDPAFQHAGPPAALLGRELERCEPREDFVLARTTFEILRPDPGRRGRRSSARVVRPGRSVELLEGELKADGEVVVTVRAWRVKAHDRADRRPRRAGAARARTRRPRRRRSSTASATAARSSCASRPAAGGSAGRRRCGRGCACRSWPARSRPASSACSRWRTPATACRPCCRSNEWLFINTELTVHFRREPRGEWICLDAETTITEGGAGLARSTLSDDDGVVALGAQSLLVAPRG